MSENLKLRKRETVFSEYINEAGEYVKSKNQKEEKWGFYLKFCGEWFWPCKADQEKLKNLVLGANRVTIGNKDYEHPIELNMTFDFDNDHDWEIVEHRLPTEKDLARVKAGTLESYNDEINKKLFQINVSE